MYKLVNLNQFALKGINSDLIPWDLDGSYLTEISNVRIANNQIYPNGGYSTWATLPIDFVPGMIMPVGSISGSFWMIPGLDAVYVYDGTILSDVSNPAGYAGVTDADLWTGCMLSRIPVINNPGSFPEYWSPQQAGILMQDLPWDAGQTWRDVGEICRIMRSHKQYLFALNLQSGAQEIPDGVRWSSPADINGLPETWDPLDVTNYAGLTQLGGDGGDIVDGLSLRDAFVVYREGAISIFDFVGGPFVWRIRHMSQSAGLVAIESLATRPADCDM